MTARTPTSSTDPVRQERRAMIFWSSMIIGLLLTGIITSVAGAIIAVRGKPVVEEDYYNKALHWDDQLALEEHSIALGWKTAVTVGDSATSNGQRALMLHLTDKSGVPIEDAKVDVAFFHRATPLDLEQLDLKSVGNGTYAASAKINRAGTWEFRITIRHAGAPVNGAPHDDTFVKSLQKDLLE